MYGTLDPGTSTPSKGVVYERRRPETGTLYQVVRDNLQTLYAAVEDGFAAPLPAFVRDEFERYLACGILYALIVIMRGRASRSARRGGSTLHPACIIPGNVLRRVRVLLPRATKGDPTDCYNAPLETTLPD